MGLLNWIGLGVGFGILAGIPLFWDVAPMRALTEGDAGWFGFRFRPGRGQGKLGRGWGFLLCLGCIIRNRQQLGFGI